jgi:hypothetical protein
MGGAEAMKASFDTDSNDIKIDNCATCCISNQVEDFVGPLYPSKRKLRGIGSSMEVQEGTIQWEIEDDDGVKHKFLIPHSIYAPKAFS